VPLRIGVDDKQMTIIYLAIAFVFVLAVGWTIGPSTLDVISDWIHESDMGP
jgi:hypothetical protein